MWTHIVLVLGAYLYGSLPFVWSLARLKRVNLREHGDRHVGGGNLVSSAGIWVGILGSIGDFSKGVVPIVIGHYLLDADLIVLCLAGLAALIGQMWPISLRFYGGRGGSTIGGIATAFILTAYLPWQTVVVLAPLLLGIALRNLWLVKKAPVRSAPLGMLVTVALLPLLTWLWGEPSAISLTFSATLLLVIIRRLTADISADLRHKPGVYGAMVILTNRLLYDRSYLDRFQ